MKEQEYILTLQETEQLCRLYMDCRLTVLEETELQYVLGRLPYSSPCIDEARVLMGLSIPMATDRSSKKRQGKFNRKVAVSVAASVAVLFSVSVGLFNHTAQDSSLANGDVPVFIAAYSHGERLNGSEAVAATNMAMAKADSLMKYASQTERDHMMKAKDIILTTKND